MGSDDGQLVNRANQSLLQPSGYPLKKSRGIHRIFHTSSHSSVIISSYKLTVVSLFH